MHATMDPSAQHQRRFADPEAEASERNYATATHLIGLLSLMDMMVMGLIGAIVMWRIRAADSPFLDDHGREAVNFQLSLLLYAIAGSIIVGILTLGIGLMVWLPLLYVFRIVGCVMASIAANKGEFYRYPMCVRFLKGPQG